jgi:hypothetical protein
MSDESARRVLEYALTFGDASARRLAHAVLTELETADERRRRIARERKWHQRHPDTPDGPDPPDPSPPLSRHERDQDGTVSREMSHSCPENPRDNGTSFRDLARTPDLDLFSVSLEKETKTKKEERESARERVPEMSHEKSGTRGPSRSSGTRIPSSSEGPAALEAFAKKWGIDTTHAEWPKFVDTFRSYPDAKRAVKAEWDGAWRNWLRRSPDFASRPASGPRLVSAPRSTQDVLDEAEQKRRKRAADEEWRLAQLAKERAKEAGRRG